MGAAAACRRGWAAHGQPGYTAGWSRLAPAVAVAALTQQAVARQHLWRLDEHLTVVPCGGDEAAEQHSARRQPRQQLQRRGSSAAPAAGGNSPRSPARLLVLQRRG